jgi:hypothetical protein
MSKTLALSFLTSHGLLGVRHKAHPTVRVRHDLVGVQHGHVELHRKLVEVRQHAPEHLLPGRELATPDVVNAEERSQAVDNDHGEWTLLHHDGGELVHHLHLVVRIEAPTHNEVL